MSVISGFFNSLNGDRRYNAEQMSAIFDGIINDGVFANIGDAFAVTPHSGHTVNVGVGRAWFNGIWIYNDAILPITTANPEVLLNRYDAVVIEIDKGESVRQGSIKMVQGTPASTPVYPELTHDSTCNQYPIAYIYRKANAEGITQADVTYMVGQDETPFVTGILEVVSIAAIVAQWRAQWNQWYLEQTSTADAEMDAWMLQSKSEFETWFNTLETTLEEDVATQLTLQMIEMQERFNILFKEGCIYDTIDDSAGETLQGSDGTDLEGKAVMGGSGQPSYPADVDPNNFAKRSRIHDSVIRAADWVSGVADVPVYPLWINDTITKDTIIEIALSENVTKVEVEAAQSANILDGGWDVNWNCPQLKCFGDLPKIDIPIKVIVRGDA